MLKKIKYMGLTLLRDLGILADKSKGEIITINAMLTPNPKLKVHFIERNILIEHHLSSDNSYVVLNKAFHHRTLMKEYKRKGEHDHNLIVSFQSVDEAKLHILTKFGLDRSYMDIIQWNVSYEAYVNPSYNNNKLTIEQFTTKVKNIPLPFEK